MGLGWGSFQTTLRFDGEQEVETEMTTVSFAGAWLVNDTWTVRGSVGAVLDGELVTNAGARHEVEPGGLLAAGVEYRALTGQGSTPFIDLSLFVSGTCTQTVAPDSGAKTDYSAADVRLGGRAGWSVNGNLFPYVAARVCGGPVNWELNGEDVVGTDVDHYQLALGTAWQLGAVGLWAEWAGVGEQALSAGASTAW